MAIEDQKQSIKDAIEPIRAAEKALLQASNSAPDTDKAEQIDAQYRKQDALLSRMLHSLALGDDAEFAGAANSLRQQSSVLQADQAHIQSIVDDVGLAAEIVGFLAQAAGLLAKL